MFTLPDKETDIRPTKIGCIEFIIICVGIGLCGGVGVGQCERTITPEWDCNPFLSDSIVFNENSIASVIAELSQH